MSSAASRRVAAVLLLAAVALWVFPRGADGQPTFGAVPQTMTVELNSSNNTAQFACRVTEMVDLWIWGFWIENPTSGPSITGISVDPEWPYGGGAGDNTTFWSVLGRDDPNGSEEVPPVVLDGDFTVAQVTVDYTGAAPDTYTFTFPTGEPLYFGTWTFSAWPAPLDENPVAVAFAPADVHNFVLTVNAQEAPTPDPMTWSDLPHLTDPNDPNSTITMTATQAGDNTTLPDDITYEVRVDGALILGPQVDETFVHTLTAPGPNEPHTFEVRAIDEAGNATAFSTPAVTVYTPANPPTNGVVGTVDSTSIAISWDANSNPSPDTVYKVEVWDNGTWTGSPLAPPASGVTTDTSFTCSGLTADNDYWVRVCALNGDNQPSAYLVLNGGAAIHTTLDNPPSHDADYRGGAADWHIDIFEVLRITDLYNSGGEYHVDLATADGFAPGPGSHDPRGHDGDYRSNRTKDWHIDIFEVLRITDLYNSGGEYHVDDSTQDGFAPGTGPHAPAVPPPGIQGEEAQPVPPPAPTVTVTRTHDSTYTAGDTIDITINVTYDEALSGFAVEETLPAGWTFVSVTDPDQFFVKPNANQGSPLGFLYQSALGKPVPVSPFSFTYRVNVPGGQTGTVTLMGDAEYSQGAGNVPVPVDDTTVDEAPAGEWTLQVLTADVGGTTNPVPGNYIVPAGGTTGVASAPDPSWTLDFWELDGQNAGSADPTTVGPYGDQEVHTLKPVFKPVLIATRTHAPTYTPGGTFDITIDVQYEEALDGLAFEERLPTGWTFVSVTDPDQFFVKPGAGQGSPLGFLYQSALGKPVPASPFSFTYTVQVPGAQTGTAIFTGEWEYSQGGGDPVGGATPDTQADSGTATITVLADPADQGLEVKIDGVAGVAPQSKQVALGSDHNISVDTPQLGLDGYTYRFGGWSDGDTANPRDLANVQSDFQVTANFIKRVDITFLTDPTGLDILYDNTTYDTDTPTVFTVDAGTNHLINAPLDQTGPAGVRYSFDQWQHGGAQEQTVAPTDDVTYTALNKTEYLLTLAANPANSGTVTVTDPLGFADWFPKDTTVTLEAAPVFGFIFTGWSTGETTTVITVLMDGPKAVTANFVGTRQITINTAPQGLNVQVDGGAAQAASVVIDTVQGAPHTVVALSPQGDADTERRFTQWNPGATTDPTLAFTADGITAYTASFATFHALTTTVVGSGGVDVDPEPDGGKWIADGERVTLTANPDPGWRFKEWSGDAGGTANQAVIPTMDGPKGVTATFIEIVDVTVDSNPQGIQFVSGAQLFTTPHTFIGVDKGTPVPVVMPPNHDVGDTRHKFDQWAEDGNTDPSRSLPADATRTWTANYIPWHKLTTLVVPDAAGTVDVTPDKPGDGAGFYPEGTVATLTAVPADISWVFTNWTGDAGGTNPTVDVTLDAPKSATANFATRQWTLNVNSTPIAPVTITGTPGGNTNYSIDLGHGDEVSLSAPPTAGGLDFVRWDRLGHPSVSTRDILIPSMEANESLTAVYEATPEITISIGDIQQNEGNAGDTLFNFTVSLSAPAPGTVTVD